MLYLASGVLCVDSSENQLEEFRNFTKDCEFMRKYAVFLQIHNILENTQISNMNSDFVPASTVSQQREPIPYICGLGARFGYEHMKRVFKPPRLKSQIQGIGSLCERLFIQINQNFLKYFFVSATTTPFNARSAIRFGIAIRPFTISGIVHTAETVM